MTTYLSTALPTRHGFFTRHGGVSQGVYASLNCSFSSDAAENVRENRARAALALQMPATKLLGLKQVHGRKVAVVTSPWAEGQGPEADALVTATPGLALGIITADCAPVLFCSPEGVVGAAHAGWRGALAGVLEATAVSMQAIGASRISAAIGPCIHQKSYEVGSDMRDAVLAEQADTARFFINGRPGHFWFDLPGYCAARLARSGIAAEILPHDTCAEENDFFSYRRKTIRVEPATGHQISVICS